MSHNVNISNVEITNENALRRAIDEMISEGLRATLVENGRFRGWGGRTTSADLVLQLNDYEYDVGFNRRDNKLVPVVEDTARGHAHLSTQPGTKTVEGKACDLRSPGAFIGRLVQRINVCAAEMEAARSGYISHRVPGADGTIAVEVEVGA